MGHGMNLSFQSPSGSQALLARVDCQCYVPSVEVSIPIGKSGPFSPCRQHNTAQQHEAFQSPSGSQALLAGTLKGFGSTLVNLFQSPSGSQALLAAVGVGALLVLCAAFQSPSGSQALLAASASQNLMDIR